MASKDEGVGFLRVALGNFARTTRVSAEQVRREVALSNCPVTSWTVMSLGDVNKLSKDSFSEGELLELSVRERMPGDVLWKEEPEKIGVVDADRMYGHVILPPHAFAPIWSAAEATDGSRRSVELELKARHPEILSVTNVGFFEAKLQDNTAAEGEPTERLDPILVELREMRKELIPLIRSATFSHAGRVGLFHSLAEFALSESTQIVIVRVFRRDDFLKVETIPTGKLRHGVWPSDDDSRIYVGLENDDEMVAIAPATNLLCARGCRLTAPPLFPTRPTKSPRTSTLSALSFVVRTFIDRAEREESLQFRLW